MVTNTFRHILLFVISVVAGLNCFGLKPDDTMTGTTNEHIRSLQMTLNGDLFAPPVLIIGSNDILTFSFDHIADDRAFFRYKLQHCNANWQPSQLVDSEIINGFNEGIIDDFEF